MIEHEEYLVETLGQVFGEELQEFCDDATEQDALEAFCAVLGVEFSAKDLARITAEQVQKVADAANLVLELEPPDHVDSKLIQRVVQQTLDQL